MKITNILLLCALTTLVAANLAQDSCRGQANEHPYVTVGTNLDLLILAGPPDLGEIAIVHMWGSPYEMGYAHGQLLQEEIGQVIQEIEQYFVDEVAKAAPYLPEWLDKLIGKYGVRGALQLTAFLTEEYTPKYFFEELHGIADGAGVNYERLLEIHMFPELTKAACSMSGAWGSATSKDGSGSLVQLRALDFITNGPFQKYPALFVYHPESDNGHPFSILSWKGFIGAITGISQAQVGICEKVWLGYDGESTRMGIPFYFLLRDILQFDADVPAALDRIQNAHRTCSVFLGVGDPVNKFRAIAYSYPNATVYTDADYPEYPNHPRLDGVIYIDKHVQPSKNPCMGTILANHYGAINSDVMIREVAAKLMTGDLHAAVYDYGNQNLYFSNGSPYVNGSYTPAYNRPWIKVSLPSLWKEAAPTNEKSLVN